ncbi:MAG: YceI family protein [bacterium]|nr:YceI family protein [bacterium]
MFLELGEIRFDLETGAADGEVAVDAPKAVTGNKRRDRAMHNKVLESERFPSIVFRVTGVEGRLLETGGSELTLDGRMAIHGDEHPVSVPVRVEKDNDRILVRASLVVPYAKWGLHRPSVLFLKVAPEVEVRIEAKATLAPAVGGL